MAMTPSTSPAGVRTAEVESSTRTSAPPLFTNAASKQLTASPPRLRSSTAQVADRSGSGTSCAASRPSTSERS